MFFSVENEECLWTDGYAQSMGVVDDRTGSRVRMNLYPEIPYFVRRLCKLDDLRNQLACDIVASFSSDMITSAGF